MGPPENPTGGLENQEDRPKRLARRPRMWRCLLKGCEERFPPGQARQRYCSEEGSARTNPIAFGPMASTPNWHAHPDWVLSLDSNHTGDYPFRLRKLLVLQGA